MENETKLCKHCKSEIPKGAKVCPNCRKKQGGIGKWIVIVVVVVIIIAAMSGGGADKTKKVENASTQNNTDNKAETIKKFIAKAMSILDLGEEKVKFKFRALKRKEELKEWELE